MVKNKVIAIIPARGGSKRIPDKNILPLHGKPMIAYTIAAALNANCIDEVIVSTDSQKIADISLNFGATVPFLRESHYDDHSTVSEATVATLSQLIKQGYEPTTVVQLMANCPNRTANDIDDAFQKFSDSKTSFQISCFRYGWMNPWWAHTMMDNGKADPLFDRETRMMRSQDQPELYCPTGAIWIADFQKLMQEKSFYGPEYSFHELAWASAIDIDDLDDLKMAKYLMDTT